MPRGMIIFARAEKGSDIGKVAQKVLDEIQLKGKLVGAEVKPSMNSVTVSVDSKDIFSVYQTQRDGVHMIAPLDPVKKYGLDYAAEKAGYKKNCLIMSEQNETNRTDKSFA
jgi:hypothetical protein